MFSHVSSSRELELSYTNKDKRETSLCMPGEILPRMKETASMLDSVVGSDLTWSVHLHEKIYLVTHVFNQKRWVGFHKRGDDGKILKGQVVNIPLKDFQFFMLKVEEMITILGVEMDQKEEQKEGVKSGGGGVRRKLFLQRSNMFLYHGDVLRSDGTPLFTTLHGELSEELARQQATKWMKDHHLEEDGKVKISSTPTTPFPARDIMKGVWLHTIIKKVEEKAGEECEGCQMDSPSQKDHLEWGGCLSSLEKKIVVYYGHVAHEIHSNALVHDFDRVVAKLGLPPKMGLELARAIPDWLGRDGAIEAVTTKWVSQERIQPLFRLQEFLAKCE